MKRIIIDLFSKNIGLKVASIFVAIVLWVVVVSIDDPVTSRVFSQIPVEFVNTQMIEDMGMVYEIADGADTASVTVWAKRSILDSLSRDNFKATADLSKLKDDVVPIEIRATRYTDRIEDLIQGKSQVRVMTEKLLEKQFRIELLSSGQTSDGCIVGKITSATNVVKVSGPESVVSEITKARAVVDVSGIDDDIAETVNVQLENSRGDIVEDNALVMSTISIPVNVNIWKMKHVPLVFGYVGTPAAGYGVSGAAASTLTEVAITGESDKLAAVNQIVIPSSAIDITGAKEDVTVTIPVSAYMPDSVRLASDDEDEAAIVVVPVAPHSTKTVAVPLSNVTVTNVPHGMTAEIGGLSEMIPVEITGIGEAFNNAAPEEIKGVVDLSKYENANEEGVIEVTVEFVFPDGITGGNNAISAQVVLKSEETVNNN